jgi:CheY-like chemotaxis protein
MGGEISIKDKEPGERGTCFAFNVLLKISEVQQPQDIEEGPSVPLGTLNRSISIATAFQEASNFKGVHCVLYVHGYETRRILQTWMESIEVKVWLVPQAEFIGSTLEKVQSNSTATATTECGSADRCFSSKEMVNLLRNNSSPRRAILGGIPSGILVVIDVSGGETEEICQEMAKLARIKHQAPCKVVLLEDIKTPSNDLRRLKDMGCDLVLRKPVHGSRQFTLLMTLRDLQVLDAQAQSSHVGPEIAGNRQQQDLPDVVVPCVEDTAASTEASCLAQEQQKPGDDKPLAGMRILLAEDNLVLQSIQRKIMNQLGAFVTVAQNGAMAVNLLREALEQANASEEDIVSLPYHVIFMDCQVCSTKTFYLCMCKAPSDDCLTPVVFLVCF